jgi:nucleotide-binding universal stress UspA family protein
MDMKRILVPVDFSKNSLKAARFAIRIAELAKSDVCLLHVTNVLVPTGPIPRGVLVKMPKDLLKDREHELQMFAKKVFKSENIEMNPKKVSLKAVDNGSVRDGVLAEIKNFNADLLVMGTCGASGFKEFFIGSNTASIMEDASCPVLSVPEKFIIREVKTIALATELQDTANELKKVVPFAKLFGAAIEVFHTFPNFPEKIKVSEIDYGKLEADLIKKSKYDYTEIIMVETPFTNDVVGGIEYFIKRKKPQILVMFSTKRNWFDKITEKSKTKKLIFHSKVPVLSFKREKK